MEQRSISVARPEIAADGLGFFRWGRVAGRLLVTNDAGEWAFLADDEFADLIGGRVDGDHARFEEFQSKGFVRDGLDLDALATRLSKRSGHVRFGPRLHVVNLTRRADESLDMTVETADKIVDFALKGTAPMIRFEFQGADSDPFANFAVLRHFVEQAQSINQHTAGKTLRFRVLGNLGSMTNEIADWMIDNDVLLSTTLDGPADLHDDNRHHLGGASHSDVARWIEYFQGRYAEAGRDARQWNVDARLAVTARTLASPRQVVDEYAARKLGVIHVRPLEAWAFDTKTWSSIGYTPEQYLSFRRAALDCVLESNRAGNDLIDSTAAVIAMKILTATDPDVVDLQSPTGAGTSQVAYGADGRIFPCDEARAIDDAGESLFEIGNIADIDFGRLTRHPTVRSIASASLLDAQPVCGDSWNKPYSGVNPVRTYLNQGDLFGQYHRSTELGEQLAIATRIFEALAAEDAATKQVFERWAATESPHIVGERLSKAVP